MVEKMRSPYEQLERRLEAAESTLRALRDGSVAVSQDERETLAVRLAETQLREAHVRQVLGAIQRVNEVLITEDDPRRLIERVCSSLVQTLCYYRAVVVLTEDRDPAAERMRIASAGFDEGFDALEAQWREGQFSPAMARALVQDELVVVEDLSEEFPDTPHVDRMRGHAGMVHRLHLDGRLFGLLLVSMPQEYLDDTEEHAVFSGVADDLAFTLEKLAAERELRCLWQVVSTVPHPIAYVSSDYRYLAINDVYLDLFDVPRDHILGRPVAEVLGGELFEREIRPRLDQCLAGEEVRHEMLITFPRGGQRWIGMEYYPHYDGEGRVDGIVVHGQDITERRLAEAALRESEERYRAVFEQSSEGILLVHDVILECNRRAAEILGRSREGLIGHSLLEFAAPVQEGGTGREAFYDQVRRNVYAGQPQHSAWRCVREDGSIAEVEVQAKAILVRGRPTALLVARDLTELRRAESEQTRLREQYRQAQKLEAVGRLAGGVAHDFNNMLSVILGNVELAADRIESSDPLAADLAEIRKAAERSAQLTRQLLAFARKQTVAPRVLDLNETLAAQLSMLRRLIGENIELTWRPAADLRPVEIDPGQIAQVLANLCVNARDAIGDVGEVIIATENVHLDRGIRTDRALIPPGDYVRLSVGDTGRGMDAETLEHAFEPFFTTKTPAEGTGLGLATVYGIVKQNGGFIDVDSAVGEGTTFYIYLPPYVGPAERRHAREAPPPVGRGRETVLFVEDEPAVGRLGTTMLESLGYHVLTAATPGEAVALAREHGGDIDLLITDVIMPEMDGRDLAERISELHPDVKCLFISGYAADVIAHRGVLDKGVHFMQKPFTRQELAAKVREALGKEA